VAKTGGNDGYVCPAPERRNSGVPYQCGRKFNRACAAKWGSKLGMIFCRLHVK